MVTGNIRFLNTFRNFCQIYCLSRPISIGSFCASNIFGSFDCLDRENFQIFILDSFFEIFFSILQKDLRNIFYTFFGSSDPMVNLEETNCIGVYYDGLFTLDSSNIAKFIEK